MIRRLRVSNFRSLGPDTRVDFGPLTVLVGQNGAGKSNVLDVLTFIADALHMGLAGAITHRSGIQSVRRWSDGHPLNLSIAVDVKLPNGSASYEFVIVGDKKLEYRVKSETAEVVTAGERHWYKVLDQKWSSSADVKPALTATSLALQVVGGDARFSALAQELSAVAMYSIFPDTLRKPQAYDAVKPMLRHGENWASILHDQDPATWKADLVAAMAKLSGDVEDIDVKRAAGFLVPRVLHTATGSRRKKWFDVGQESDGTLRAAGIITALLQSPAVPVIGIEEPELTIHPGAVPVLVDFLREASQRSQVIIATHSPEMLDLVKPEEIRVVTREAGVSVVRPLDRGQVEAVRSRLMSLGDLHRTVGLRPQIELDLQGA